MQNWAAFLHPAIVAAADDLSSVHNHATDRYPALSRTLARFCNGGAQKLVLEICHLVFPVSFDTQLQEPELSAPAFQR
jgi:hypothetical protein